VSHPPFVSYDFQPAYVYEFGTNSIRYFPSMRALAKDGTIWETHQSDSDVWRPWRKVGEAPK
jgi:hypothetical protein